MKRTPFLLYFLGLLLFSSVQPACVKQASPEFEFKDQPRYSGYLYLCTRSTESKEGRLVRRYNHRETEMSHIGLAFSLSEEGAIYNMYYDRNHQRANDLVREDKRQFFISDLDQNNRVWAIAISEEEHKSAVRYLNSVYKKGVQFDFKIDSNNDEEMYCSELVYNILIAANEKRFALKRSQRKLKKLEALIMKKEAVDYYPVDFFLAYQDLIAMDW
ncbi:MAG: hypothetical protein AAF985_17685 [Bacteroidota bacterium]